MLFPNLGPNPNQPHTSPITLNTAVYKCVYIIFDCNARNCQYEYKYHIPNYLQKCTNKAKFNSKN